MGDGDHGWAAAEFLSFVRNLFVQEEHSGLALGKGVSREWIETGRPIAIEGASSRYGTVSWHLERKESRLNFSYSVQRSEMQLPTQIFLCLNKEIGDIGLELASEEVSPRVDEKFHVFQLHGERGEIVFSLSGGEGQ